MTRQPDLCAKVAVEARVRLLYSPQGGGAGSQPHLTKQCRRPIADTIGECQRRPLAEFGQTRVCHCNRLNANSLRSPHQFERDGILEEDLHSIEIMAPAALQNLGRWYAGNPEKER